LPRMQRTRAIPVAWLNSGLCPDRPKGWIPIIIIQQTPVEIQTRNGTSSAAGCVNAQQYISATFVFLPFHSRKQNYCGATWLILLFQFYILFKISQVWHCTNWSCIIRGGSVFNKPVVSGVSSGPVNCRLVVQRRCVVSQTKAIIKYSTMKTWKLTQFSLY